MDAKKFETMLTRAVAIGGLGCFIPSVFLFQWTGISHLQKWHMYVVVTVFLVALGVVNRTRELVRKQGATSSGDEPFMVGMKLLAVGASFLIGSILSVGFVLTFLLFLRSV